jgi:hypothetical protein
METEREAELVPSPTSDFLCLAVRREPVPSPSLPFAPFAGRNSRSAFTAVVEFCSAMRLEVLILLELPPKLEEPGGRFTSGPIVARLDDDGCLVRSKVDLVLDLNERGREGLGSSKTPETLSSHSCSPSESNPPSDESSARLHLWGFNRAARHLFRRGPIKEEELEDETCGCEDWLADDNDMLSLS